MIETVLLDIDDTILDFTLGERVALRLAFEHFHLPFDPVYATIYHEVNALWWGRYDAGEVTVQQVVVERFVDLFRRIGKPMPLQFALVYEENLRNQHAFIRGAKGFVQRLGRRYRVYAVSNGRTAVQTKRLRESGLDKMILGVFVSEDLGVHKPQRAYFDLVASRIEGYVPERTVLVGNSLSSDIAGGKAAGVHTVWYNREHLPLSGDAVPDYESESFHEIETYIASL